VIFTVNQVAPRCRAVGRFSVAGHAGLNHVSFASRMHGQPLQPGTYRISARTARGRLVRRITLVVVAASAPTPDELRAARAANVCRAAARSVAVVATSSGSSGTTSPPNQAVPPPLGQQSNGQAGGIPTPKGRNAHSGVLAQSIEKTARAVRPYLVALLALAILLLGAASLPKVAVPDSRMNYLLSRHRVELAGLGAVALGAVAIAFLL
jgi:hypothetical protein